MTNDLAWATGLFEGEGSIYVDRSDQRKRDGKVRLEMSLASTDEDVVRRFRYIAGGTVFGPYTTRRGTKPYWTWKLRDEESIHVLVNEMWPYLGRRRREQVEDAIASKHEADASHTPKPLGRPRLARKIAGQMGFKC